jgi:hypothetical protein
MKKEGKKPSFLFGKSAAAKPMPKGKGKGKSKGKGCA